MSDREIIVVVAYLTVFGMASFFCLLGLVGEVVDERHPNPEQVRFVLRWWLRALIWPLVALWYVGVFVARVVRLAQTKPEVEVDPEAAAEVEDALRRKP